MIWVSSLRTVFDHSGAEPCKVLQKIAKDWNTPGVHAFAHLLRAGGIFRRKPTHLTDFGAVEGGRSLRFAQSDG